MDKYVVVVAALPFRKTPSHRSEMVNQVLFGEELTILDEVNSWIFVRTLSDQYEGWVENRPEYFEVVQESENKYVLSSIFGRVFRNELLLTVPIGSFIGNSSFSLLEGTFHEKISLLDSLEMIIQSFKGAPYLWGGKTPFGVDCSGLVQLYGRLSGLNLPRDAKDQARIGEDILLNQFEIGDLIFFDGNFGENVNHVGIICEPDKVVHSSGSVRMDTLTAEGIYNADLQKMTHKYLFAKRIKSL